MLFGSHIILVCFVSCQGRGAVFFLFVFGVRGIVLRLNFKMNVSCSFVLFGPPQAENFAVFRFLFTFLHVSGAISLIFERTFSRLSKNSTYSGIFQLGVRGKFQKKIHVPRSTPVCMWKKNTESSS